MIPPLARGITRPSGIVVPGEPRWGPSSVPGLCLYLDPADAGATWTDRALGRVFAVPSGDSQPTVGTETTGDGRTVAAIEFNGSDESYEIDEAVFTGYPATVIVVAIPSGVTATGTVFAVADKDAAGDYFALQAAGGESGDPVRVVSSASGSAVNADTPRGYAAEPIVMVARLKSATSRVAALDDLTGGSETTSSTPAGLDRTSIGRLGDSTPSAYFGGKILLVLAYDRDLSDGELLAVADWAHREKIHNPGLGIPALGLALDLDPSDASTLTITSSPDVDSISNRANKGIASLSQSTAANKPHLDAFPNGLGALLFDDAASQHLVGSAVFTSNPFSVVTVALPDDDATEARLTVWSCGWTGSTTNHWALLSRGDSDRYEGVAFGGGKSMGMLAGAVDYSVPNVVSWVESASNSRALWANGSVTTNATEVTPDNANQFVLGTRARSEQIQFMSGRLGRNLVYKRAISAAEVRSIQRALRRVLE